MASGRDVFNERPTKEEQVTLSQLARLTMISKDDPMNNTIPMTLVDILKATDVIMPLHELVGESMIPILDISNPITRCTSSTNNGKNRLVHLHAVLDAALEISRQATFDMDTLLMEKDNKAHGDDDDDETRTSSGSSQ